MFEFGVLRGGRGEGEELKRGGAPGCTQMTMLLVQYRSSLGVELTCRDWIKLCLSSPPRSACREVGFSAMCCRVGAEQPSPSFGPGESDRGRQTSNTCEQHSQIPAVRILSSSQQFWTLRRQSSHSSCRLHFLLSPRTAHAHSAIVSVRIDFLAAKALHSTFARSLQSDDRVGCQSAVWGSPSASSVLLLPLIAAGLTLPIHRTILF